MNIIIIEVLFYTFTLFLAEVTLRICCQKNKDHYQNLKLITSMECNTIIGVIADAFVLITRENYNSLYYPVL